jgi:hypothetical protein
LEKKRYSTLNIHPKIVEKYIESIDQDLSYSFSRNPSDLAVDYLLKYPDQIHWWYFVKNTNPRAIEYILRMWDDIPEDDKEEFSSNKSQKAVDWLIQNPSFIYEKYIQKNPFNYTFNRLKYVKSKRILVDTVINP